MEAIEFVEKVILQLASSEPTITQAKNQDGDLVISVVVKGNVANVIGKQGKTVEAVRTIAKALGSEGNHRVKVKINEHQSETAKQG